MIPITLHYRNSRGTQRKRLSVYAVPRVGEKVIPPGEDEAMVVLTVEHDARGQIGSAAGTTPTIWVVLS